MSTDNAATTTAPKRYSTAAIILHWTMALAFFIMLASGVTMEYVELEKSLKFQMYQWHKSGGVLLLLAFFLRIGVRALSTAPPPAENIPSHEKILAKIGHLGLYIIMLLMPLSGWIIVSSSSYGLPTIVFNLFEWPHIPGIQSNEFIHEAAENAHLILAILLGLLIIGHIAATVKHAIVEKENLLPRMWWST